MTDAEATRIRLEQLGIRRAEDAQNMVLRKNGANGDDADVW